MKMLKEPLGFSRTLIALVVLAACGTAYADDDDVDVANLNAAGSSVTVGVGAASGSSQDRARFGLYNGLRDQSVNGLMGFEYDNHNSDTGKWTTIQGNNLGLDNRELDLSVRQLGDWKFTFDYSELVRHDPRTINTGELNAGSTAPTVVRLSTPGSGSDVNLELKRKSYTFGLSKWVNSSMQFQANFKNEDKDGARMFARGFACTSSAAPGCGGPTATATGWALLMIPEPINSNIKQAEAKINFSGAKYLVSGGYYGTFYTNSNGNVDPTVPGTLNNALGNPLPLSAGLQNILSLPMALPPDNQAHQVYIDGNYRFTPTTNSTFRAAYTHATQNEDFASMGLTGAPAGITNLGAVVNTTLLQAGLTARPLSKLNVVANVRYENKDNKTPVALYNIEGVNTWTNAPMSPKYLNGKLEGTYALPHDFRATVGTFYKGIDHGTIVATDSVGGVTGVRQKTDEWGYRGELRRMMSENLTGALGYERSFRHGSTWLKPVSAPGTGVTPVTDAAIYNRTGIFPYTMADRMRDMIKLSTNWTPTERLSLQFWAQGGIDHYGTPSTKGLDNTSVHLYSVDAVYVLSDKWKLNAYWQRGEQTLQVDHSTGYMADLRDISDSIGVGFTGKPAQRLQVGGDLSYINDKNVYGQTLDPLASAANQAFLASSGGLPNVTYRLLKLSLHGDYALQKNQFVRVNVIHYHDMLNEWTWGYNGVPFAYADNTTITANPTQNVTFVGVSWMYKWQ